MGSLRDDRDTPAPDHATRRPPTPPHGHRILAWATATAILLGGMNAFVQMARLVLGH